MITIKDINFYEFVQSNRMKHFRRRKLMEAKRKFDDKVEKYKKIAEKINKNGI